MSLKKKTLLLAAMVSLLAGSASADRIHGYGDARNRNYTNYNRGNYYPQVVRRNTYVNPNYNTGYYNYNRAPVYNQTYYPSTYNNNNGYYNNGYYNNGYYSNGYNNGYNNNRPGVQLGPVRLNF